MVEPVAGACLLHRQAGLVDPYAHLRSQRVIMVERVIELDFLD